VEQSTPLQRETSKHQLTLQKERRSD